MFVLTCRRSPPRRIRRIWGLRGPGSLQTLAEPAQEVDQGTKKGRRAALEAPRRTNARQLPHEHPEVEATDVHEQAFEDIVMAAQMYPAHAPGLVEMRVGPFHPLAALPQQALSTITSNPPPGGIHRFLGCRLALPLAPTAIRLRHIAPDAEIRKPNHRLVAVIPLVAHDLGDSRSAVHRGDVNPPLRSTSRPSSWCRRRRRPARSPPRWRPSPDPPRARRCAPDACGRPSSS